MRKKFTDWQEKMIITEYQHTQSRYTLQMLAQKYNCSVGTIYNILHLNDIKRRGRGKDVSKRQTRKGYADQT